MEQKIEENAYLEKRVFILSTFLLAVLIISTIVMSYLLLNNKIVNINDELKKNEIEIPVFEKNDEENKEEIPITYMIKEYNGKIGIYENNSLIYTMDTYIFTLPETDKKLLTKGITTTDKAELYAIIEEYY